MRRIDFSAPALDDLSVIAGESETNWGPDQRVRYLAALRDRIRRLTSHPELGPPAQVGRDGVRRLRAGRHLVFYRIFSEEIRILRILHERMDHARHLGVEEELS
jgi:toxin ParE1/3/4